MPLLAFKSDFRRIWEIVWAERKLLSDVSVFVGGETP
jgi:hypothetical protein